MDRVGIVTGYGRRRLPAGVDAMGEPGLQTEIEYIPVGRKVCAKSARSKIYLVLRGHTWTAWQM